MHDQKKDKDDFRAFIKNGFLQLTDKLEDFTAAFGSVMKRMDTIEQTLNIKVISPDEIEDLDMIYGYDTPAINTIDLVINKQRRTISALKEINDAQNLRLKHFTETVNNLVNSCNTF